MSRRAPVVFAVTLSLAVLALPACGGDEPPEQRAFTDEDETETPSPPKQVPTQVRLKYVRSAFVVDITAAEDYCEEDRTVTIFEDLKKDKKVGRTESSDDGDAMLKKRVVGRYYAEVATEPSAKYGEMSICKGKRSQTVIVKK